jgi:hypothetical protein
LTFFWGCVAAGFAVNVVPSWLPTTFNFSTSERNIHPDPATGQPILNTDDAGYPPYYTPRLNGLLFAGGLQAVVELSAAVQWILSTPPFLILFPHVFTIYLIHGLVFWTYGSWLMVFLAERGFPYGINVAIVGVTSYGVLFAALPIVTPVIEALGKDMTALVWMTATNKSPPRRRTLFPYPDDLFASRTVNEKEEENQASGGSGDVENGLGQGVSGDDTMYHARSSISEKGKGKAPVEVGVQEMQAFDVDQEQHHKERQTNSMVSRFSG